jgi:aspartate/methionine/tyrosine aminotransferase
LSQVAATAAYTDGWPWAEAFLDHLRARRDQGVAALTRMGLPVRSPEGTYVLFPSVEHLGVDPTVLVERLREEARVAVVPGAARWFGPGAEGRIRIVFSTSEALLGEGLARVAGFLSRPL